MQSGPTVDAGINDDSHTTISSLRTMVDDFVSQRDWKQFHSPKNLSMALAIEAPINNDSAPAAAKFSKNRLLFSTSSCLRGRLPQVASKQATVANG